MMKLLQSERTSDINIDMESDRPWEEAMWSHFAGTIDQILAMGQKKREVYTKEYGGMILEPLREAGIDIDILEHLDIDFVDKDERKKPEDIMIGENTELGSIQKIVLETMGPEVFKRLNFHLSEEKIRVFTLPREKQK